MQKTNQLKTTKHSQVFAHPQQNAGVGTRGVFPPRWSCEVLHLIPRILIGLKKYFLATEKSEVYWREDIYGSPVGHDRDFLICVVILLPRTEIVVVVVQRSATDVGSSKGEVTKPTTEVTRIRIKPVMLLQNIMHLS